MINLLVYGFIVDLKVARLAYMIKANDMSHRDFLHQKYALVFTHRKKMIDEGFMSFYYGFSEFFIEKKEYMNSEDWKSIREYVMKKYNGKCYCCKEPATDVHHETYERLFQEIPSDLKPLCRACHKAHHDRAGLKWTNYHRVLRDTSKL